jgi:hypothetical protein
MCLQVSLANDTSISARSELPWGPVWSVHSTTRKASAREAQSAAPSAGAEDYLLTKWSLPPHGNARACVGREDMSDDRIKGRHPVGNRRNVFNHDRSPKQPGDIKGHPVAKSHGEDGILSTLPEPLWSHSSLPGSRLPLVCLTPSSKANSWDAIEYYPRSHLTYSLRCVMGGCIVAPSQRRCGMGLFRET